MIGYGLQPVSGVHCAALFTSGDEIKIALAYNTAASGIHKGLAGLNIAAPPFPKAG